MSTSDNNTEYITIGSYSVPIIDGYAIGVYAGNLIIEHDGDTMVVEAFSKPKSWTPFHDLMQSMSQWNNASVVHDDSISIDDVVIVGIDDVSWFSRSYITTHHDTKALRDYYKMIRVIRGDAPMPPLTRLTAVSDDDDEDIEDEISELGNTVISSFTKNVNQDKITIRAS